MKLSRFPRPALAACVAICAIGGFFIVSAAGLLPTDDQAQIQRVVSSAIVAEHTLEAPPAGHSGPLEPSLQRSMEARAVSTLRNFYTGAALGGRVSIIDAHIQADGAGNVRYLAGGMDSINFTTVSVSGSTALVIARAVVWNRVAQQQGSRLVEATPRGPVDYTFTLVKTGNVWLISSEDFAFPPGSGP